MSVITIIDGAMFRLFDRSGRGVVGRVRQAQDEGGDAAEEEKARKGYVEGRIPHRQVLF